MFFSERSVYQCDIVDLCIVGTSGVIYTRWGRLSCGNNDATLLYKGTLPLHTVTVLNSCVMQTEMSNAGRIYVQQMLELI